MLLALVLLGSAGYLALGRDQRPRPVFTKTPDRVTSSQSARFAYRVPLRGARFTCSLDGARQTPCGSRRRLRLLAAGRHRFCVQARTARVRSRTACFSWVVRPTANLILPAPPERGSAQPFSMTASAAAPLSPGGAPVPVDVVFDNPNRGPITITAVVLRLAGSEPAGCASAIDVVQQLRGTPVVPGTARRSLAELGVPQRDWPLLELRDTGTDQNACRGAALRLALTGEARG